VIRRFPQEFLATLPDGVTYNDPARKGEKEPNIDYNDPNIVVVADFTINIDRISKQ